MLLTVIALAPAIGMIWLLSAWNPSGWPGGRLLAALAILGGTSAGLALVLNHAVEKYSALWSDAPQLHLRLMFWVLGIGLNEEFSKLLVLLLMVYPRRQFTAPYQGLLTAGAVALGFAAVENLVYLERYGTPTLLIRSLLTVPAHAGFTIPLGVCLAYARRHDALWGKYLWMVGGLAVAVGFHGVYNIWLSFDQEWLNRIAYAQVVLMQALVLGGVVWLRLKFPQDRGAGMPQGQAG
jgi:RsiW-degrading membrane proteinase PrsW (M82 family)